MSSPTRAKEFYGVIVVATLVGMALNYVGINPIDALFYTAVINGLLAPPLLVLIMLVSNRRDIMGEFTNSRLVDVVAIAGSAVILALNVVLLLQTFGVPIPGLSAG